MDKMYDTFGSGNQIEHLIGLTWGVFVLWIGVLEEETKTGCIRRGA